MNTNGTFFNRDGDTYTNPYWEAARYCIFRDGDYEIWRESGKTVSVSGSLVGERDYVPVLYHMVKITTKKPLGSDEEKPFAITIKKEFAGRRWKSLIDSWKETIKELKEKS